VKIETAFETDVVEVLQGGVTAGTFEAGSSATRRTGVGFLS
jgi:hypothetical protein